MSSIDEQLQAIREELGKIHSRLTNQGGTPTVLTMKRAAFELSVSLTTLKALIKSGDVLTVTIGRRRMVPMSEVRRRATPEDKVVKQPRPKQSSLQDSDALRASLKR